MTDSGRKACRRPRAPPSTLAPGIQASLPWWACVLEGTTSLNVRCLMTG